MKFKIYISLQIQNNFFHNKGIGNSKLERFKRFRVKKKEKVIWEKDTISGKRKSYFD